MEIKSLSKLGRFKDIVLTLIKHGFADMVERMDLPGGDHSRTDAGEGDSAAGQISALTSDCVGPWRIWGPPLSSWASS